MTIDESFWAGPAMHFTLAIVAGLVWASGGVATMQIGLAVEPLVGGGAITRLVVGLGGFGLWTVALVYLIGPRSPLRAYSEDSP